VPAVGERPPPARIADWTDPVFSPEIAELRSSLEPMAEELELTPDAVVGEARASTGLDDLGTDGDPGWHDRLELLLRCLRRDARLGAWGTVSNHGLVVQLVRNRLLLTDLLARHPEIHEVPVERPIIILGLPRTGTTHLHNVLAADPSLRTLPYWESLQPVVAPGAPDERMAVTELALDIVNRSMPLFVRMHEMTPNHAHEEIQLLAIDMSSMLFETTAPMPSWRDHFLARDQTPSYRYLRTVLQALTWLRGGDRWVLKTPQHLEQIPALLSVFPDATFVVTHRDPVAVTGSVLTMLGYAARMTTDHPDPLAIGRYWAPRVEQLLHACLRDHELLPPERTVHVRLPELVADDMAVVERIYATAEQPFDERARAAVGEYVRAHPQGRHGTVEVDWSVFAVDPDERRVALADYADAFGV
jgi:hypothetical protein